MKSLSRMIGLGVAVLIASAGTAMSGDRLIARLSLTPVAGNCPSSVAGAAALPVDFTLPEASPHAVQNRFRFNYRDPLPVAHQVTISGQIADYGTPGCTVAFTGAGVAYD